MLVIRPVREKDIDQVVALASEAKGGLTTLPVDQTILAQRIEHSIRSFERDIEKPEGELYFFVLEDTQEKKILGTCAIVSKVGGFEPFYTYEIKEIIKQSERLKVKKTIQYLQLRRIHSGPSEIGTLFLSPEARKGGNGRLLSLSRFLFMAQYRKRFEDEVIAEMRGVLDDKDCSPFWNAVCKHFFVMDFKKADLMVMEDKLFIEELIPQHPIYIPILPKEAQAVIGKVHKNTEPARAMLEKEGFVFIDEVDIFEAGPVVGAKVDDVRSVRESQSAVVAEIGESLDEAKSYLIANVEEIKSFCVTQGSLDILLQGQVRVTQETAQALNVVKGSKIRFVMGR